MWLKPWCYLFVLTSCFMNKTSNFVPPDYDKLWEEIEVLEKKGLVRSALERVETVYLAATKDGDQAHRVKAYIYKNRLQSQLEEEGDAKRIMRFEEELESFPEPMRSILHFYVGQYYIEYLQRNRWKLSSRTELLFEEDRDVRSWSFAEIEARARYHFLEAGRDPTLREVDAKSFGLLLYDMPKASWDYTLYDVLIDKVIRQFEYESFAPKPVQRFRPNKDQLYASAKVFSRSKIASENPADYGYIRLELYRQWLAHHLGGKQRVARSLIDAKRLALAYSILPDDDAYPEALQRAQSGGQIEGCVYQYYEAQYFYQKGRRYVFEKTEEARLALVKAVSLAQKAMKCGFMESEAKQLLTSIERKALSFAANDVYPSDSPLSLTISYRNHSKAVVEFYALDEYVWFEGFRDRRGNFAIPKGAKKLNRYEVSLPGERDYQAHSVELLFPSLPFGPYLVVVRGEAGNRMKENLDWKKVQISDLAILKRDADDMYEMAVVGRMSGDVVGDAQVDYYRRLVHPEQGLGQKIRSKQTNESGLVRWSSQDEQSFVGIRGNQLVRIVRSGRDQLILDGSFYIVRRYPGAPHQWIKIFTDRAIYRPGQKVFFKGIRLSRSADGVNSILPGGQVTVSFFDANSRELGQQDLRVNEYGSFSGFFEIPTGVLNGQFSIRAPNVFHRIRVEEYKRPTFEMVFDSLDGDYVLGQKIVIGGVAKNLAGNAVQNAKVRYRITKNTYFSGYERNFINFCFPGFRESQEIAHGTVQTDESGRFSIDFVADSDPAIPQRFSPTNHYNIAVTVIDRTGESHDFNRYVTVGKTAVRVQFDGFGRDGSKDKLRVEAYNYNQVPKSISGRLRIVALKTPDGYKGKGQADRAEYRISDVHNPVVEKLVDLNDNENWEELGSVYDKEITVDKFKDIELSGILKAAGRYKIHFEGKDVFGHLVSHTEYMDFYLSESRSLPSYEAIIYRFDGGIKSPGEKVFVDLFSNKKVNVLVSVERKSGVEQLFWQQVDGHYRLEFDVTESDRGNFKIDLISIVDERVYSERLNVIVPWTNKQIEFEYLSFRDKVIPGSDEKWIIKLRGKEKDRVVGELLATMYDASLDAFISHSWAANFFPTTNLRSKITALGFGRSQVYGPYLSVHYIPDFIRLPGLKYVRGVGNVQYFYKKKSPVMMRSANAEVMDMSVQDEGDALAAEAVQAGAEHIDRKDAEIPKQPEGVNVPLVRTNLKETVFFFPHLRTDDSSNVVLEFRMNEALTRWKFLAFVHDKELRYGFSQKELVTQKDFMVFPLFPRYFRERDKLTIKTKVVNLSDEVQDLSVYLELRDGIHSELKNDVFGLGDNRIGLRLGPNSSKTVSWEIDIPDVTVLDAVRARVVAQAGNMSDGEEHLLPVLTNRKLVTEALPMPLRPEERRSWTISELSDLFKSSTATMHRFSVEMSSNPAWYAVLALPYMDGSNLESIEAKFSKFYVNTLAAYIVDQNPKIKAVFEKWKLDDSGDDYSAFVSQLEKNKALKALVLRQTPWVAAARTEQEQRRRIALLFDLNRLAGDQKSTWLAIQNVQNRDGGFSWMPGAPSSWYMTLRILTGLAHLEDCGAIKLDRFAEGRRVIQAAVAYSDVELNKLYERIKERARRGQVKMDDDHLSMMVLYHLYMRHRFVGIQSKDSEAQAYFLEQVERHWMKRSLYAQGLIALIMDAFDRKSQLQVLLRSVKERSLIHEELGRYWNNERGYYWYQRPVETQALMIEVFHKLTDERLFVEELKLWLLKHKQTNHWKTSKATAEAIYALLLTGPSILSSDQMVDIMVANKPVRAEKLMAGTGYYKKSWNGDEVDGSFEKIEAVNPNKHIAWGAAYWQYFEDLDRIRFFKKTPIKINKSLTKKIQTDKGPKLVSLKNNDALRIGERVVVRIEIEVDRDMEYVHLQDMRAVGLEPVDVLSGYRWNYGLGYYQTIKDASAEFFISYLPKGSYVFEYELKATHAGYFSNGITTIQSYYAPEYTSHSKGIRLEIRDMD